MAYVEKYNQSMQKLQQDIKQPVESMKDQDIDTQALQTFATQTSAYQQRFEELVAKANAVGLDHQSGYYGALRKAAHELENQFKQVQNDKAMVSLLQLRRAEKDFMLRSDLKYVATFEQEMLTFKSLLSADGHDLAQAADSYAQAFLALVAGKKEIGLQQDQGYYRTDACGYS
ncbi:MAG: hypothetical protein U5L01_17320 [Rheinheimera sp.]|nr:hypothetical protein [Rheinheimera sp.]